MQEKPVEPLVPCACGQPAAWRDHQRGMLPLCDDCSPGSVPSHPQAARVPLSSKRIAAARARASAALGDFDVNGASEARWLATLDAAEARGERVSGDLSRKHMALLSASSREKLLEAERDVAKAALARALAHVEALEQYIYRVNTCVVCECWLYPSEAPPHCEDSCGPDDEQQIEWEDAYLQDPVAHFRAKFAAQENPR